LKPPIAFQSFASNFDPKDTNGNWDVYTHTPSNSKTTLISRTAFSGFAGNGESVSPAMSANGNIITFSSFADDLVAGDTNGTTDVFLATGAIIELVSIATGGAQGTSFSVSSDISDDGNLIVFQSRASNLVAGDSNLRTDIFVRNKSSGTTTMVSTSAAGVYANSPSGTASISGDGSRVAFVSSDPNLIPIDTTPNQSDTYLKNLGTGAISAVSVSSGGVQGNFNNGVASLSANGNIVVFASGATNLVPSDSNGVTDVFLRNVSDGITRRISLPSDGNSDALSSVSGTCCSRQLTGDGRFAVYVSNASNLVPADTNGVADIFVYDRLQGTTRRVSVSSAGVQANAASGSPTIARDGRYIAFRSPATNLLASPGTNGLSHVFVHDLQTAQTSLVSLTSTGTQPIQGSGVPTISANGRYVAFSNIDDLVGATALGYSQVYLRDTVSGITTLESRRNTGVPGENNSDAPSISADGLYLAFASRDNTMVLGDSNLKWDIFIRDRQTGLNTLACINGVPLPQGNMDSRYPSISDSGQLVAFETTATNINGVLGDSNGVSDIYVCNMAVSGLKRASVSSSGTQANAASTRAALSGDGRFVAYNSVATNLVTGDSNGLGDVFITDLNASPLVTQRLSIDALGQQGTGTSAGASLSTDGSKAIFESTVETPWILDAGRNGSFKDVFWVLRTFTP